MALGDEGCDVARLLVQQGAIPGLAGIAAGLPAMCAWSNVVEISRYGNAMADFITLFPMTVVLLVPERAAGRIPAQQASPRCRLQ
jgi:hypothetical protein